MFQSVKQVARDMKDVVKEGIKEASHNVNAATSNLPPNQMTTVYGAPIAECKHSLTAGPNGPVLMQDYVLQEKIHYFARERTAPRNVHALGFGAFGKFTVTNDITRYSSAAIFNKVGNTCETFTRFSGVFTERGDPSTIRDLRGFATKFYTEEGNWDMLCVNTPVFNARDMKIGPDVVHAFKRDPRTGEWYGNQTWDFVATHPEGLHTQLMIYTDRAGTPKSFRTQNWWPCHTFSLINAQKERTWVRFHLVSQQGWEGMNRNDAAAIAGEDPNFHSREMREAIDQGLNPKWKLCIQAMPEAMGNSRPYTFDCTKVWKHDEFPLIDIGMIECNRNPENYHTTTESVAFSPARVPPGIGYSPDKLLQGRIPLYDETQAHRLGPNHQQLPINCPFAKVQQTHAFQGQYPVTEFNKDKWPHYTPSLYGGLQANPALKEPALTSVGPADYYPPVNEYSDEDIYLQPREFLFATTPQDLAQLVDNLGYALSNIDPKIVTVLMGHFRSIDTGFGTSVQTSINQYIAKAKDASIAREACVRIRNELGNPPAGVEEKRHGQPL